MKIKEETKALAKAILESDDVSTLDKYVLIVNIEIIDNLITDTLKFVESLFKIIKSEEEK